MPSDSSPDRTRDLVDRALSLVGDERETYLQTQCGEDTALRAEVDALIAELGTSAPIELEAETQVGPYKLFELLGEGGFGRVYLAEQREPVRRQVALKVIKLGMDTRQVIARFEAERQALSMMSHPNIAQVLDVGSTEHGRPYFVMELVRGVSITEYCRKNALPLRERLELFISVCNALQHAHQKGVIHRDIKPSNVLVSVESGQAVAKVIDFGIAKATHRGLTDKTLVTLQAQVIGTPVYMPPEQADQSGLDVDTRSDIYALGVLLYELLTGVTPFDHAELEPLGRTEMLRVIREVDPPRPSERARRGEIVEDDRRPPDADLPGRLAGDLDWIVVRCLEKDRTRRYGTASELAAEVRRHLDDEPVLAGPPSATYRLGKFVRRNRTSVVAAGVALSLLLVGIVGTTGGLLWALDERERADALAESEREASAAAQLAADEAREALARLRAETERADEATAHAEAQASQAESARAQARRRADELERMLDLHQGQLDNLDRAALAQHLREDLTALADALPEDGRAALHRALEGVSFVDLAMDFVRDGILGATLETVRTEFADMPLMRARLEGHVARAYADLQQYAEAEDAQRASLAGFERQLGIGHPETMAARDELGDILVGRLELQQALAVFEQTLAERTEHLGPEARETLATQDSRAVVLRELGRLDECRAIQEQLAQTFARRFGNDDLEALLASEQLAQTLFLLGDFDACREVIQPTLERLREHHPHERENIWRAQNTLALAIKVQGNLGAAREQLEQIHTETHAHLGRRHRQSLMASLNLGGLLMEQRAFAEADALIAPAVEINEELHGRDHTYTLQAQHKLAELRLAEGRHAEGLELLRDAWVRMGRFHDNEAHPQALDIGMTLAEQLLYSDARDAVAAAPVVVQLGHTVLRGLPEEDGRRSRALAAVNGLVRALDESFPADTGTDDVIAWLNALASAYNVLERFSDAETLLQTGEQMVDASVPRWRLAESRSLLGEACAGQRRRDEARELLHASHLDLETEPPSRTTHMLLERSARRLARHYEDDGDAARARAWRARVREIQRAGG